MDIDSPARSPQYQDDADEDHDLTDIELAASSLEDLQESQKFISMIKDASLGDDYCGMEESDITVLQNPVTEPTDTDEGIDPDFRLSLDVYLACINASQDTYSITRDAIRRRYPDSKMLSYYQTSRRIRDLSGVVPIAHHMCVKSCMAYTGPFSLLVSCKFCNEPRYMTSSGKPIPPDKYSSENRLNYLPRLQYHTIPLGPQLQALFRNTQSAENMKHRQERTRQILEKLEAEEQDFPSEYDDVYCGQDYLEAVRSRRIDDDTIVVNWSEDGAQLYQSKKSDAWIGIWTVMELSPHLRYKRQFVLPGVIIPGPNNPRHLDSFVFPTLHHVGALQNEGLTVWDASCRATVTKTPYVLYGTADSVAAADINGWVGHHGRKGCRYMCGLNGRHKPRTPHYFPVLLRPTNCNIPASNHPDIDINELEAGNPEKYQHDLRLVLESPNTTQYKLNRKETGITKPTIFLGLRGTTPVPRLFPGDCMHRDGLNLPELLIGLSVYGSQEAI